MKVHELIQSSLAAARLHFRRVGHLSQMSRAPSPIVRIAASSMLGALKKSPKETVFEDLEHDFRIAGHTQIADAIAELAEVLDSVLNKQKNTA
ncbi:MAG: hypothetical protein AAF423_01405 [Pseudomonadota bacterium]